MIQNFDPLLKCEHYDDYREFILGYKTISFTRSTKIDEEEKVGLQECYEKIKKQMEKLKLLCLYNDRETLKKSIVLMRKYWNIKEKTICMNFLILQDWQ